MNRTRIFNSLAHRMGEGRGEGLLTRIFRTGNKNGESHRDSGSKPRVARNELPWQNAQPRRRGATNRTRIFNSLAHRMGEGRGEGLLTRIFRTGNKYGESHRDSGSKPRVARNELPWENAGCTPPTPTGLCLYSPCPQATTPLGLPISSSPLPRVATSSQPRAGGHNLFGIGNASKVQGDGAASATQKP